ncbi:MAG: thermonuclease family protein [Rubrobacter sp.]|nr:thermonuclease family protein [Rubrobacter sp.]
MKKNGLTGSWLSVVVFSVLAVLCALPGCSSRLVSGDPPGKSEKAEVEVTVTRATDGDTVKISLEIDGEDRVRLIGVDTPETNPGRGPEPYGEEATRFTRERLEGRDVSLEFDAEREDDYGRLLAYAYLPDGTMFNETLLREGYAQVATFPPNTRYLNRFEDAQEEAREARRGIWGLPEGEPCRLRDRGNGIGGGCE